ncbi:MAG: LytR/AlgR family response regulator transcription factor, partial [Flavobacteriales bacterium]
MNTRVLIIDDEEGSRESLKHIIQQYFDRLEIIGTAASADAGYEAILKGKPDLVFLDIEMPGGSAFDLLERFDSIDF